MADPSQPEIFTAQELLTIAQRVTGDKTVSVVKHSLKSASAVLLGNLGSHNNLTLTIQKGNKKEPEDINLFVKSVPFDARTDFIVSGGFFQKETLFFDKVVPILTENYKSEKWTATTYLIKNNLLVMEDLRIQGYNMLDPLYDHLPGIKATLAALARFHSCSILAEARLGSTMDKQFPNLFNETMFIHTGGAGAWVQASIKMVGSVAERYGHDPEKITAAGNKIFDYIQPSKTLRNVLCHGDLWANNVMFNDDSEPLKCILVDFQLLRYAPLELDILQLLHINTSRKFRDQNEKTLIKHYHSVMEKTIKDNDPTGKIKIPALEQILTGLDDNRLFGALVASFYRILGAKVQIERAKDPEKYGKTLMDVKIDFILYLMEKEELFKSQVEDVVHEIAENCLKI